MKICLFSLLLLGVLLPNAGYSVGRLDKTVFSPNWDIRYMKGWEVVGNTGDIRDEEAIQTLSRFEQTCRDGHGTWDQQRQSCTYYIND